METNILTIFQDYFNETPFFALFVISLIFCLIQKSKHQKTFILGILLLIGFVYNDLSRNIINFLGEIDTYYRFIWILPVTAIVSYAITEALSLCKDNIAKNIFLFGMLFILIFNASDNTFIRGNIIPDNKYNMQVDIIQICDIINSDYDSSNMTPEEILLDKRIAAPAEIEIQIRPYDASFSYAIGRFGYMHILNNGLYSGTPEYLDASIVAQAVGYGIQADPYALRESIDKLEIKYLVVYTPHYLENYLGLIDCEIIGYSNEYAVYRVNN